MRVLRRSGGVERTAIAVSALWLLATVGALVVFGGAGLTSFAIVMLSNAIVLPLAVIWLFVFARRLITTLAEDNARLRALLGEMRHDLATIRDGGVPESREAGRLDLRPIETRLSALAEGQRRLEAAIGGLDVETSMPASAPDPAPAPVPRGAEPAAEPASPPGLALADLVEALQFPADPDDTQGFDALRRALRDRPAAQLVTSAQDVLTLLSQDGIYMDDLDPPPASPDLWRLFAAGDRGEHTAVFGEVGSPELVDRIERRIREDTIFRDTVDHFSRLFEARFSELADDMTDAEIAALIRTRSARAFFVLGRAMGLFEPE